MARIGIHEKVGKNRYFSVSRKLRNKGISSEDFETILSTITLEDLIALRLELAARHSNGKLHGIFLWKRLQDLIKDAIIKAALSITLTKKDACRLLGVSETSFKKIIKKYNVDNFFEQEDI
jgi:transcriptional regulator with AAA-type ATPase domain|tara:strand:+ start:406 stop:768 length:363 start_codon:yes stop_codon:yes gene_type:complete